MSACRIVLTPDTLTADILVLAGFLPVVLVRERKKRTFTKKKRGKSGFRTMQKLDEKFKEMRTFIRDLQEWVICWKRSCMIE